MARIVALLVVALLAAAPAAALAAAPPDPTQSPFQQAPPQNQIEEQPTETQAPSTPAPQQTQFNDGSISGFQAVLIGIGIVALIGGIWFVIARDAKRVTAGRVPAADGALGRSATRAARRSRRLSAEERRRRKRGRAR